MKKDYSIKRLLAPGALLMAAATGLVSSLGCSDLFYSTSFHNSAQAAPANTAAQDASQAAVADGVQQGVTGQMTGDLYGGGHGDY